MKKHLLLIIALMIAGLCTSCVGPFFVNYALTNHNFADNPRMAKFIEEFADVTPEMKANGQYLEDHKNKWLESTQTETWQQITSDGLVLNAAYFPNKDSHKYAIVVHGWTSKKEDMYNYGAFFYDWGYNVLAPDNRSHGTSEGKYIGMGWLDSYDYINWIDQIVEKDPQAQIVMLGVSMGGATVMMTSGLDIPSNVKCIVEDCGYSGVYDEFSFQLMEQFHLGSFPVMDMSNMACILMCGYSLKEASSTSRLAESKVPMLFIHGTKDSFVPYFMLDENIKAYRGPYFEVLRVEGAQHAQSLTKEPELYLQTVKAFCDKFVR